MENTKAKTNRTFRGDTTTAMYLGLYPISPQPWPRWATRKVGSVQLTKDAMINRGWLSN